MNPSSAQLPHADDTWHEIEDLVDDLANLSKSELTSRQFYSELLDRAVSALAAVGGAVWSVGPSGQLQLEFQIHLSKTKLNESTAAQQAHAELLRAMLQAAETKAVPPHSGPGADGQAANPTEFLIVVSPLLIDERAVGLLEVFQRPGASPATQRGYVQLMTVLAELAADFLRNKQLRELRSGETLWNQFDQFARRAHDSLNLDETAYTIANEGRRLIGCDRLSVLLSRGRRCRLRAVSGLDSFDRRANVVRRLEQLVESVLATGESLWYEGQTSGLSPQIETSLQTYLDESHARSLAIVPLEEPFGDDAPPRTSKAIGALVIEHFDADTDSDTLPKHVSVVARHSATALRNATTYENIPLMPVLRTAGRARWLVQARRLPLTILVLLAVVAAVAAMIFVPADFDIEGRGELLPQKRQEVFAPDDGVIDQLKVKHADQVSRDAVLAVLRKPELDLELSRVIGEMQTIEKQLLAVQTERLTTLPSRSDARDQYYDLTAKEVELEATLESLQQQLEILRQQQTRLTVTSPLDGQLLTWDVAQSLEARPVKRGQVLMTVADPRGAWVLELNVPDHHVGYVLAARQEFGPELDVSFIVKADPEVTYRGRIEKLGMATETDEKSESSVPLTVSFDRDQIPHGNLRPGATVIANIHCGQKPIGYVWLHDLIEAVRTRVLF